jgi:hypothetical protein
MRLLFPNKIGRQRYCKKKNTENYYASSTQSKNSWPNFNQLNLLIYKNDSLLRSCEIYPIKIKFVNIWNQAMKFYI